MDFEKNRDLKTVEQSLRQMAPAPSGGGEISEKRFRQYCAINREIAISEHPAEVFERVIDAAIEISGAERGFLLVKNDAVTSPPLPGYEVKAARHFQFKTLKTEDIEISLSIVKEAIAQGAYVLTRDALQDERFHQKKSIQQFRLRSILAVPLEVGGSISGALYLDHRSKPNRFSEEDLLLVIALASQAALAVQKTQWIAQLKEAKSRLEEHVESQAERIDVLTDELDHTRTGLRYGYDDIVGRSPGVMAVFELLDHVTETAIPVWIWGESGTGKELVARALHYNSPRKEGPFITENVSAIPETLLESELFGHKKGAFTHADRDRTGLFEQADGGTLFMDEIGDMSPAMQVKLLRVLQEGEVRPVGSDKKVKVDVRLVTASNRDLNQLVRDGKFREDLFYRINGLTIKLPPLRERREDIPLLIAHLSKKIAKEFRLPESEVADDALELFLRHDWPGNIRELESTLRNAFLFARGKPVTKKLLASHAGTFPLRERGSTLVPFDAVRTKEEETTERRMIADLLKTHRLDKDKVAQEMGVSLRTLYNRMMKLGIPKKKQLLARYLRLG